MNSLTFDIINAAMKVHSILGAGLLEHAYHACLLHELQSRNLQTKSEVSLPIVYDKVTIDIGYRLDLLVENEIIVEIKSVKKLANIHTAQLLTYLKLADKRLGLLINFNTVHLRDGIRRLINS